MMNHLKTKIVVSASIAAALATLSVPGSALTARYRVSGTACRSNGTESVDAAGGLKTGGTSVCPIPTGPGLAEITGTTNKLASLVVNLKNETTSAQTLGAGVVIHDDTSASFCSCGTASASVAASAYKTLAPGLSCGTCSWDAAWTANARITSNVVPINGAVTYTIKSMFIFVP
jgi:hypothetical protein